jgi:hypothetical protein
MVEVKAEDEQDYDEEEDQDPQTTESIPVIPGRSMSVESGTAAIPVASGTKKIKVLTHSK